jgi:tyrosyl-tRNA synthetase
MTLSEELSWRGFVNQTTFKDITTLDGDPITFYLGVDPSANSMQIGNLAMIVMVRHFVNHGHKAVLLVGGATGLIGDPDGKAQERDLKTHELVAINKAGIAKQFRSLLAGKQFELVDNYDWFKDMNYLEFLRTVGKHVPMSQMLGREFVQSRLGEGGAGISYAEFSYSLIQGYDFLHMHQQMDVTLQVCGADQWGNSIAGVDLIRRVTGDETHIWSAPLIINKSTGIKFGKTEAGVVWLDPAQTSPTAFYQFWINLDDSGVEDYLKIYTFLTPEKISGIMTEHNQHPQKRTAQTRLAEAVTELVHGNDALIIAQDVTAILTEKLVLADASEDAIMALRREIPTVSSLNDSLTEVLISSGLANSNAEARRLIGGNAISINGKKLSRDILTDEDFVNGRLLLRRGKAFKDSALIEHIKI